MLRGLLVAMLDGDGDGGTWSGCSKREKGMRGWRDEDEGFRVLGGLFGRERREKVMKRERMRVKGGISVSHEAHVGGKLRDYVPCT